MREMCNKTSIKEILKYIKYFRQESRKKVKKHVNAVPSLHNLFMTWTENLSTIRSPEILKSKGLAQYSVVSFQ